MNTEDRLRRASDEIDRATASVTAPPIADLRRSARTQGMVVTVATAAAVCVLVVGAALLLNGSGATTLEPAGPGRTTASTVVTTTTVEPSFDGIPIVIPDLDPEPEFDMPGKVIASVSLPEHVDRDLSLIRDRDLWSEFERIAEIRFVGSDGTTSGYVLIGSAAVPSDLGDRAFACVLGVDQTVWGVCNYSSDAHLAVTNSDGPHSLVGWVGEGTSVVSMETDASQIWARTRQGYVFISDGNDTPTAMDFTAFSSDGSILSTLPADDLPGQSSEPCSGSDIAPSALALSSIPQPVAETLGEIVDAARRCDFTRLEEIAGDDFTASYGGGEPPELWTQQEENGDKPMYWLLSILNLPGGTIDTDNGPMYVWPAAYAHQGSWETTPQQDMDALRSLYTEDDLQGFADFGGYYGYRVGITASGDWLFFVAGD